MSEAAMSEVRTDQAQERTRPAPASPLKAAEPLVEPLTPEAVPTSPGRGSGAGKAAATEMVKTLPRPRRAEMTSAGGASSGEKAGTPDAADIGPDEGSGSGGETGAAGRGGSPVYRAPRKDRYRENIYSVRLPLHLRRGMEEAARRDGLPTSEWFRRLLARELNVGEAL